MATVTNLSGLELIKWQSKFWREYIRDSGFKPYMGEGPDNIIKVLNDLQGDMSGYTCRVPLVGRLQSDGVVGNTRLGGAEQQLDQYYQEVSWEFYREAFELSKRDMQRSAVDQMEVVRPLLREWAAELIKYQIIDAFHAVSSGTKYNVATTAEKNTWTANNVDRVLFGVTRANYSATHATGLGTVDSTADKLSTSMASLARFMARTANPHIKPFKTDTGGREYYVMFCHPICFRDLKTDTAMINANRDARAREGSAMDNNPLFQDGDMLYDGIIFREMPEFYTARNGNGTNPATHIVGVGASSIDVGANFLCGTQAIAYVNKQAPTPIEKKEDDYGFFKGRGIELAQGMSKMRWNNGSGTNKDYGMVTVYASAAA
jgi:N4-gp56 family major capsid protein